MEPTSLIGSPALTTPWFMLTKVADIAVHNGMVAHRADGDVAPHIQGVAPGVHGVVHWD